MADGKKLFDLFRSTCERAVNASGQLTVTDLTFRLEKPVGRLAFSEYSKKLVQMELEFVARLEFTGPEEFWSRGAVIAWAMDVIREFCNRSWPKDTRLFARRSRFIDEASSDAEPGDVPTPDD
jgi:hypothetical protein